MSNRLFYCRIQIFFFFIGKIHYSADFLHEPARLTALVSGACIIFLCFRKRGKVAFLVPFFCYLVASTGIGVISIASAPGGENISPPIPFFFFFFATFFFLGDFLSFKGILGRKDNLWSPYCLGDSCILYLTCQTWNG